MKNNATTTEAVKVQLSKFKGLNGLVYPYLIECIDFDGYEYLQAETPQQLLQQLFDTFVTEKLKHDYNWLKRYGNIYNAFADWLAGLPSCYGIDFEYYKIIQLAEQWQQINPNLTEKQRENREDYLCENWFHFVTAKTFQLFKKYNVNTTVNI